MNTADFERARSEEMRRILRNRPRYGYDARREQARQKAATVDWAAFRRRAWEIFIGYVIVADFGLILIAIRDR